MTFTWTVTIKTNFPRDIYDSVPMQAEYVVEADKPYTARRDCLERFITENKLPFRPYELLTKYRHFVEMSVRCSVDGRTVERIS